MGLFVLARFLTVGVSILTLWFGLGSVTFAVPEEERVADVVEGEEEAPAAMKQFVLTEASHRLAALAFILVIQLWVFWTFLRHQLDRSGGEKPKDRDSTSAPKPAKKSTDAKKADKSPKPEVSPKVEKSSKPGKTGKMKEN
eukprot:Em0005g892a